MSAMAPAATNESSKSPHFLAGGSYVLPGQEKQPILTPSPEGQGQRQAHVFLECVDATMVDPTVISVAPTPPLCEGEDLLYGLYDLESEDVKNSGEFLYESGFVAPVGSRSQRFPFKRQTAMIASLDVRL